jgi:hypothetical protein
VKVHAFFLLIGNSWRTFGRDGLADPFSTGVSGRRSISFVRPVILIVHSGPYSGFHLASKGNVVNLASEFRRFLSINESGLV